MPRLKRPVQSAASPPQLGMFAERARTDLPEPRQLRPVSFVNPDPREIFLGGRRLDTYLLQMNQTDAIDLRTLLSGLDYTDLLARYKGVGRPPYAPWLMLGLVLYGTMKGVSSLTRLEDLARVDLGCMWVCGGIMPDHSVIGDFLVLHKETLTDSFFEELTRRVLKIVGGNVSSVAGDGTVIQACASRATTLRLEAIEALAQKAQAEAALNPLDEKQQKKAAQAQANAQEALERVKRRRLKAGQKSTAVLNPQEPDAAIQLMKNGAIGLAYKASVLANSDRMIVGKEVLATSEVKALEPMLDQAERIGEEPVTQEMLDAGYSEGVTFKQAVERNIDLLCPEGQTLGEDDWEKKSEKQYPKSMFEYDETTNTYRCPAGETLSQVEHYQGNEKYPGYKRYKTPGCSNCPLKAHCTKSEGGRELTRFETDELREAQRKVMKQPGARKRYRCRQAWVEPVFSSLKEQQGLKRFRRRGFTGARLEFSLHAMAHNVRRMIALAARVPGAPERLSALSGALLACLLLIWSLIKAKISRIGRHSDISGANTFRGNPHHQIRPCLSCSAGFA